MLDQKSTINFVQEVLRRESIFIFAELLMALWDLSCGLLGNAGSGRANRQSS
jgi:hypothetical protein